MRMPDELKVQIEKALETIHQNPSQGLKPFERLLLYDAFGPTFSPAVASERIKHIKAGNFTFTKADFARAWTSILTAKRLLPLYEEALKNWNQSDQEGYLEELEEGEGVYGISTDKLPYYLLELGEGVLKSGIGVEKAWHEANEAHYIVGNIWEYSGEDYPVISGAVCGAALEALYQCCGWGPFSRQQIDEDTTDQDLGLSGAAALPAMVAWCLKQDETEDFVLDGEKQPGFWEQWLTELIPAAWELVSEDVGATNPPVKEVPFRETVHVSVYKVETVVDPKTGESMTLFSTKPSK